MMHSLLLCISLTGCYSADLPTAQTTLMLASDYDFNVFRRLTLEHVRDTRDVFKKMIELNEELADQADLLGLPEEAMRLRQEMAEFRVKDLQLKKKERELWEQQPGGISAPPPREVKKNLFHERQDPGRSPGVFLSLLSQARHFFSSARMALISACRSPTWATVAVSFALPFAVPGSFSSFASTARSSRARPRPGLGHRGHARTISDGRVGLDFLTGSEWIREEARRVERKKRDRPQTPEPSPIQFGDRGRSIHTIDSSPTIGQPGQWRKSRRRYPTAPDFTTRRTASHQSGLLVKSERKSLSFL